MLLNIPNRYLDLAPVVVTSPTHRCGTTLVQRLLTASRTAFVYGEEVGHQVMVLTTWLISMMRHLEANRQRLDESFEKALAGRLSDWQPGLAPPAEVMLQACLETYYQIPAKLADYGRAIGRPVWGFKYPGYSHDTLAALLSLMPRLKVVYMVRNPYDALSSAKARKFVKNGTEIAEFCTRWAQNVEAVELLRQTGRILVLTYEDLVGNQDASIERLEAFTEAKGVDRAEFGLKINTFAGSEADGHSPTHYIEPAALTPKERDAVRAHAGAVMGRFYGEAASAN